MLTMSNLLTIGRQFWRPTMVQRERFKTYNISTIFSWTLWRNHDSLRSQTECQPWSVGRKYSRRRCPLELIQVESKTRWTSGHSNQPSIVPKLFYTPYKSSFFPQSLSRIVGSNIGHVGKKTNEWHTPLLGYLCPTAQSRSEHVCDLEQTWSRLHGSFSGQDNGLHCILISA